MRRKQEGNGPVVRAGRQYAEAVEAVEVKSDFKFELTDLNYLCSYVSMAPTCHYSQDHCYVCLSKMASEAADRLGGHF